jgi:hypothetical protein
VLEDERSVQVVVVETRFLQQLFLLLSQIDEIVTSTCSNLARRPISLAASAQPSDSAKARRGSIGV